VKGQAFQSLGVVASDVWVVGANGVVLRGNANDGFKTVKAGGNDIYFTFTRAAKRWSWSGLEQRRVARRLG